MVTPGELGEALRALGLGRGDRLIVHTSFRSFGGFVGGPTGLIDVIRDSVGPQGLVAFPTFTGTPADGQAQPPVLEVARTPAAFWVGVVPEVARHHGDAVRSLDPTHSLALFGDRAVALAKAQLHAATPCGVGSPFVWLTEPAAGDGYVLLIGVDYNSNTLVHSLEELAGSPYHLQAGVTMCRVVDATGREHAVPRQLHEWDKPRLNFNRLRPPMRAAGGVRELRCGGAQLSLINARLFREVGLALLQKDPLFLVDEPPRGPTV